MPRLRFILAIIFLIALIFLRYPITKLLYQIKLFGMRSSLQSADQKKYQDLILENESLKFELANLKKIVDGKKRINYLKAPIYSRYPLNDRSLLVIDFGRLDGVHIDSPVLVSDGVLLGKVKSIKETVSEVQTIFDPAWRSAVFIGDSKIKAVLKGGTTPRLELIPKDAVIKSGDTIYNASPEFPLNLVLGQVRELNQAPNNVWLLADLDVNYNLDEKNEVLIITDFP